MYSALLESKYALPVRSIKNLPVLSLVQIETMRNSVYENSQYSIFSKFLDFIDNLFSKKETRGIPLVDMSNSFLIEQSENPVIPYLYYVEKGDTLWSIVQNLYDAELSYDETMELIDDIVEANG